MVSSDPAASAALREAYLGGRLSAREFVDQVLAPWRRPPVPPDGLLRPGADYVPSSLLIAPATIPRFRGLAVDLIERSTPQGTVRQRAAAAVDELFARIDGEMVPGRRMRDCADAEIVEIYCELVRAATGVADPYRELKSHYNRQALAHLGAMDSAVANAPDARRQFALAIALGILGNALDFADPRRKRHLDAHGFDITGEIRRAAALPYAQGLDARPAFLETLEQSPRGEVLFLIDNAGEIIFDLPLIRLWLAGGRPVVLAGKHAACYNDLTADELRTLFDDPKIQTYLSRIHGGSVPRIIDSGTMTIGCDLRRATPELVDAWSRAAIIYAKGQGMVQTLRYAALTRDVFHAVQVKDPAYFHEGIPLAAGDALFLHTWSATHPIEVSRK